MGLTEQKHLVILRGKAKPLEPLDLQVAALSWLEFCKLWKDYMAALREGLG